MLASLLAPLTLIATLADAPPVPAEVHAFSPDVGTRGTVIEVEGLGFGEKRPRAWLEPAEPGKRRRLRVLEHADDRVAVQLRAAKMPAGAYALVIAPRGKGVEPVVAPTPFEVRLARVDRYEPTFISSETEVTLVGEHLGSWRKPKVRIAGKRARVLSFADDRVTVRVPKKAAGDTQVVVRTAAGDSPGPCDLWVHGPSCKLGEGLPQDDPLCPTVNGDWIHVEIEGKAQWLTLPALDVRLLDDDTTLVIQSAGLQDGASQPAYLRVAFSLPPGGDLTPLSTAPIDTIDLAVFDGSPKGLQWAMTDPKKGLVEWSDAHCFSYLHLVADLYALDGQVPEIIRIVLYGRVDTQALIQALDEADANE